MDTSPEEITSRRFRYVSFEIAAEYQRQIMDLESGIDPAKEEMIFTEIVPRWMEKNLTEEQKKWFEGKDLENYMNIYPRQWEDVKKIFPFYFAPPVDDTFLIGEKPPEPKDDDFWDDCEVAYQDYDVDFIEFEYDENDELQIVGEEEPIPIFCYFIPDWNNKKKMMVKGFEFTEVPYREGVDEDISGDFDEECGGFIKVFNAVGINEEKPDVYEYTFSLDDIEVVENELKWYNYAESEECVEPILITADKRKFIGKKVVKEEETYPMEVVIFTWA